LITLRRLKWDVLYLFLSSAITSGLSAMALVWGSLVL
jgi:hypothetical protein